MSPNGNKFKLQSSTHLKSPEKKSSKTIFSRAMSFSLVDSPQKKNFKLKSDNALFLFPQDDEMYL